MAASQNNLTLVLNQQDVNGVNILNRTIGAITYSGAVGQFTDGILTTTGATTINLPTTSVLQFYLKNTHATATIQVSWTPESATGSVIATKLAPGSAISFWQAASGASGAITALSLTASAVSTTYELYLGG